MLSNFPNKWVKHHISSTICNDLTWWEHTISLPSASHSLLPQTHLTNEIWVDASTSWGIGLFINNFWAAWKLLPGWNTNSCDIGWAESIAVKLATVWATEQQYHDAEITIHSGNTSIIDAYKQGHSQNIPCNQSIQCITSSLIPANLTILPQYVPSESNLADPILHGVLGPPKFKLKYLPPELTTFTINVQAFFTNITSMCWWITENEGWCDPLILTTTSLCDLKSLNLYISQQQNCRLLIPSTCLISKLYLFLAYPILIFNITTSKGFFSTASHFLLAQGSLLLC
jgi:hypothetical protein